MSTVPAKRKKVSASASNAGSSSSSSASSRATRRSARLAGIGGKTGSMPISVPSTRAQSIITVSDSTDSDVVLIPEPIILIPSPPLTPAFAYTSPGHGAWGAQVDACIKKGGQKKWDIEGFYGLPGSITGFSRDAQPSAVNFRLTFEDAEGGRSSLRCTASFQDLHSYPDMYLVTLGHQPTGTASRSHVRILKRFSQIYNLGLEPLLTRILHALQGDENANGGETPLADDGPEDEEDATDLSDYGEVDMGAEYGAKEEIGRGFEIAKGSVKDLGSSWASVKEDFSQAKALGYRPGMTQVSDYWVISYSIPLKNMDIDPNDLVTWDDTLVKAWSQDQRFTLLIRVDTYGVGYNRMQHHLTLHESYKPPTDIIASLTRSKNDASHKTIGTASFFLSESLSSHLRQYPNCYQLRTAYGINWDTADEYGMDYTRAQAVFAGDDVPVNKGADPESMRYDPIVMGFQKNLPLCAFYWVCRRFIEAARYCLNCGVPVQVPGRRPYVCDKPLCLYGMMSLGLGPSVAHTIRTHPGVIDVYLSFAWFAAGSTCRMELPLGIHVEVPAEAGFSTQNTLLDDLPAHNQRPAIVWLIDSLPPISAIKAHLDRGEPLHSAAKHPGAITILRWVIGSCRAYMKEGRPGEGVVSDVSSTTMQQQQMMRYGGAVSDASEIKQFSFVVSSPEQEEAFRQEVEQARQVSEKCKKYPTMLAFHGSAVARWHNILRTGLDFNEIACGRAYGNGVYFAADSATSMSGYAQPSTTRRANADFDVVKAMMVAELVNVPETFVSNKPYYVVNKVKQIKPFLLVVQGSTKAPTGPLDMSIDGSVAAASNGSGGSGGIEATTQATSANTTAATGPLFQHDPSLALKPTYFGAPLSVRMPERIQRATYTDTQPDDPTDQAIYADKPTPKQEGTGCTYTPAAESLYDKIQLLPPPTDTSPQANKAIMSELKAVMKAQSKGMLPFYVRPGDDRLYSWTLELFEFDKDSALVRDMRTLKIGCMIAEVRFPSSYPMSPPFIRVIYPRCLPFQQGGGGHITAGGSICHEMLTATGWRSTYCIEALVRDIMLQMTAADRPARIDTRGYDRPYSMFEAVDAFKRVARDHGWEVPKDFDKMTA